MKRLLSLFLAIVILAMSCVAINAASLGDGLDTLKAEFLPGEGPVVNGYSIDYRYFSPVKESDSTKYPIVVWLHGLGEGKEEGAQIKENNIAYWASDEFQARFDPAGGAFIIAARSREEMGITWDNSMVEPLRAAIDDFIQKNSANVDLSRIYVGGFSMGGMMALEVLTQHPEMFAAAFPYCPATYITKSMAKNFKDVPVWITSCTKDPTVNYDFLILNTWENITETSSVSSKCRLSTLTKACYPDGSAASSNHYAWFSVRYDMFSQSGGSYPYMSTVDGNGKKVTLTYPDGMISWLCSHTSDYDGTPSEDQGNLDNVSNKDNILGITGIIDFFKTLIQAIKNLFGI